ncbi:hypothetical protein ABK040_011878 [Willaertia magna]
MATRRNISPSTLEKGEDNFERDDMNQIIITEQDPIISSDENQVLFFKAFGTPTQKLFYHVVNISCPILLILLVLCISLIFAILYMSVVNSKYIQIQASNGAVASDSELCSIMGKDVLEKLNGNAVDAGIVTCLCLGITRPFASGIGGGGFIHLFVNETKLFDFIDARETAPAAATTDMYYTNYQASVFGGKAIAVMGEVKGLYLAHKMYGKLKWKDVLTPVIDLARNGWEVEEILALRLKDVDFVKFPSLAKQFAKTVNGKPVPYAQGDLIKREALANTLQLISEQGPDAIYKGEVAKTIVKEIQDAGGIITLDDLENYEPIRSYYDERMNNLIPKEKYKLKFGDYTVMTPPPPSSGSVVRFILGILNNLPMDESFVSYNFGIRYHYIVESLKFGMAHRSVLGDIRFLSKQNITDHIINQLLNDDYIKYISKEKISPSRTFGWEHYFPPDGGFTMFGDKGTSHFSIIDKDGNAFGMTTTVNHNFGSKFASPSTGIVFNNQMNDFTVDDKPNEFGILPSYANIILPRKRPQSSMAPTIVLDKDQKVKYVIGASGGPTIISSIIQVFMSIDKFNVYPASAVMIPRVHAQPGSDFVKMEEGFSARLIDLLEDKGHQFTYVKILPDGATVGVCQVIKAEFRGNNRILLPGTDPRKLGKPAGY